MGESTQLCTGRLSEADNLQHLCYVHGWLDWLLSFARLGSPARRWKWNYSSHQK